ncbi:MAG TPA: formate dehydrogenase subunit gamma [Hyphomicrobiales bacterium]|nr:formate dehydrogenase subunit gamma [Hyphomicrobiales bacterium]
MTGARHVFRAAIVAFALFTLALLVTSASPSFAQATGPDKPIAGAVPGNTTNGASADAELWRQIRQGARGTVAGHNPRGGLMIQSEGHYWQETRNGPLVMYSAWAILGILMLLALFFAIRGRIRIDPAPAGRTMKRFSGLERASHWLLASSFILLALTGLNLLFGRSLLIPLIGKEAFATIALFGKFIHNYVAFAFMASIALIVVIWIAHNIPNRHDIVWILRGGGFFGGGHPDSRKFNAGQKILFWLIVLCGVSISFSGWALLNPFDTAMFSKTFALLNSVFGTDLQTNLAPIQEQQYQTLWHAVMAVIMTVIVIAHIYIGTVGMEGALDAMTSGEVDVNWAKEHHSLWVEEVEAQEKAQQKAGADDGHLQPAE